MQGQEIIKRPSAVLFMCNMNQIRSPMAAAMARYMYQSSIYVRSAGVERGAEDGFMISVMEEIGIDATGHRAKQFSELGDSNFDLIITLSRKAKRYAEELSQTLDLEVEVWEIMDPSMATGNRAAILDAYRTVRNELAQRVMDRLGPPETPLPHVS